MRRGVGFGQVAHQGRFARRDMRIFYRYRGRTLRTGGRPDDSRFRAELRSGAVRLCARRAGRSRFFQRIPQQRHTAQRVGTAPDRGEYGYGRGVQLSAGHVAARDDGTAERCGNQYARAGRLAADARTNGARLDHPCAQLCRDLSSGRRGRDIGYRRHATLFRATGRHGRTSDRTCQQHLHRLYGRCQPRYLRPRSATHQRIQPRAVRRLAYMARRPCQRPVARYDRREGRQAAGGSLAARYRHPRSPHRPARADRLEPQRCRLELDRQLSRLAQHRRDAPLDQRPQPRLASSAQQLRHQHQPYRAQRRDTSRNARSGPAIGRPRGRRGRGPCCRQGGRNAGQCRARAQRTASAGDIRRPSGRPYRRSHTACHARHVCTFETRSGRRSYHRRNPYRRFRLPSAYHNLLDRERQSHASGARPVALSVVPWA